MNLTYQALKRVAKKERDIWVRRFFCDPITTPITYWLASHSKITPMEITILTFSLGIGAAIFFTQGWLFGGALFYLTCFLSDSIDGKLNRVLGKDDTFRGTWDFVLDGFVCVAIVIGLGATGNTLLVFLLLTWMSMHYLDMRLTSLTYRLKVQFKDQNVKMINEDSKGWLLGTYRKFVKRTGTYPHPTVGEAVVLMFIVGPLVWHFTGNILWEQIAVALGILFVIPETVGAGIIALDLARKENR